MTVGSLNWYLDRVTKLRRGNTPYGKAPHKPVLLVTILELIEKEEVRDNRFEIETELFALYRENWDLLVKTDHVPQIHQPLFHLQRDGLWTLMGLDGQPVEKEPGSFSRLEISVAYGSLEQDFHSLVINKSNRNKILGRLLDFYFEDQRVKYEEKLKRSSLFDLMSSWVLKDRVEPYLTKDEFEEKKRIRGGAFKKVVPRVYNFTCAISGMRVETFKGMNIIEACHIVPISKSGPDSFENGIALCPNLHRAFDSGLISIDANYKVRTSSQFEEADTDYSLRRFERSKITLPFGKKYYPKPEFLNWHMNNIFIP